MTTPIAAAVAPAAATTGAACGLCVLAGSGTALSDTGNGSVTVSGSAAVVDSSSPQAVTVTGNGSIVAPSTGVVGGVRVTGNGQVENLTTGISPVPDPLAGTVAPVLTVPSPVPSVAVTGKAAETIAPGVYRDITVTGNGTLTMEPGVYVILGQLTSTGTGAVDAAGVTLYLACASYPTPCGAGAKGGGISLTGNGQVTLTAPQSTTCTPLAVFADPNDVATIEMTGNGEVVGGAVYAASGSFVATGNGSLGIAGPLVTGTASLTGNGNLTVTPGSLPYCASVNLTKTVTGATVTPHLSLSALQVSAATAVPGDTLTYTTTLVNDATVLGLTGGFHAADSHGSQATVAGWWDDVEYEAPNASTWTVLGGYAATVTGYRFTVPPPSTSGLAVTATGVAATGVTYPSGPSGSDGVAGTTMAPGATGAWGYSAQLQLTPSQVATLSSTSTVGAIRNVVHFEVTPGVSGGQPFTYRTAFTDPLLSTSAAATNAGLTFTPSYTAPATVTDSTVPALASLAPGASVQVSASFAVPAVAAKGASESDTAYLARLQALEGSLLTASVSGTATGSSGPVTAAGPQPVSSTEVLPIVTIAKSGPATAQAGAAQAYQLALDNAGGATAASLALADSTPDGHTGTVSGAPASLSASATGTATSTYQIPATEPPGPLTDTATVTWTDRNGDTYGPLSASFTTTVKSSFFGSTLTLAPSTAGPDPVGANQSLTATFKDASGNPVAGQPVTLSVTGANPTTQTVTTGSDGTATFTYSGAVAGSDVAQASFDQGSLQIQSNTSTITWISPVATVGTTPAQGNFYSVTGSPSTFVATPDETPVFGQTFPTIDFNPPAGTVNHNVSGVGPTTRPFTDVTTDAMSNFDGTIVAQGNGAQAGVGALQSFDAVFTADFVVSKPGDVTFDIVSDDGFLLGVGGGASRVNGAYENAPASNTSPFEGYPLAGAFNEESGSAPVTNPVTIHFPAAGSYPYELDYFECCGGDLSLTMTVATFTAQTSPLSVYVGYADGLRPAGSIFPFPWNGSPNVTFEGCKPNCTFDGGAIRLDNSGTTPITVNSLTVDFNSPVYGNCHFAIWPGNLTLAPGDIMIFAQEANGASSGCDNTSGQFDTSDVPYAGFCGQSGIIPQVNVTTGGVEQTFADTQQILNTGGEDGASCPGGNESRSWQRIGGGGTAIDVPLPPAVTLQMTPPSLSGAIVGQSQQFQVTALDGSGNSVPSLPVHISVFGVNTQQLTATTNAAGVATFSYAGASGGTDTLSATAFVSGLQAASNQVPVTWVVPTPTTQPPPTSSGTGPPAITEASPAAGAVITGSTEINADLTPPDGGAIASWSVTLQSSAGTPVTLASGSGAPPTPLATLSPSAYPAGTYTLEISATSTAGGTASIGETVVLGSSPGTVTGGGTAGQSPPTISPPAPADGTVVTAPVPVTATLTPPAGQTIASWQVTYQGAHDSTPTTLASGTGTPPSTLATFDPTLLPDDTYTLTVTGTASGGGTQSVSSTVAVSGNLKLGREVETFDDLNVPVDGFQMDLRRVYDSSDKSVGDFGVGWHVNLANFKIATNGPLGAGGWSEYPTSCFFGLCNYGLASSAPHYVTITFPNGHQDVFDFTPSGGSVLFYWEGSAAFTPRQGTDTTDSLTVQGDPSLIYGFDGNLYDSNFDPYQPTRFVLTTRQGQTYVLDLNTGLVSETDTNGNTLTVDALGVHSSSGQSITFTRDAAGRITDVVGPTGQHLRYAYSPSGDLATSTDADGNTTTYNYDADHNLLSESGPGTSRPLQQWVYDASGRLSEVIDGDGNVTTVSNDTSSDQQVVADANGKLTTIDTFDARGDLIEQDQVFGGHTLKTTWTYDSLGRQLSKTDPLGNTTSSSYDGNGNLVTSTDADGVTMHYGYDQHGNLTSISGPDGSTLLTLTRDASGNVTESERPDGTAYQYAYDGAGHVKSITDPSGRTELLNWGSNGELTSVTDPSGAVTQLSFNTSGQELRQTDPAGQVTSYTYDPNGNLTSMTDGDGNTTSYTYDAFGHELSETDPHGNTTSYTYDGAGNEVSSTDPMGQTVTYGYDADGKIDQVTLPGGATLSVTHDALERPVVMSNPTATIDVTYDDAGQVVSTTESGPGLPAVTLGYTYDGNGDRLSMTGPEGTTGYTYDALQRLTSITDPSNGVFGFSYNGHSTLAGLTRPNNVDDTLSYSGNDLLSRVATLGSSTVASTSYTYSANGLVASMTNSAGTTSYQYDAIGELTSVTPPSGPAVAYSYDAAGNRTSGGATYGTGDQLTADANATYTYDADGELASRVPTGGGAGTTYHWNALHQLTGISLPDGSTESFGYDPLGRRVLATHGSSSTAYVYDGSNLHLEYDNAAPANDPSAVYTDGLATDQVLEMARGGQRYYYLVDDHGSTIALTDQSGNVVQTYSYDAFGNMTAGSGGSVPNTVTYTGQQWDAASGLYYYRSRWYDPTIGRFLSEDPVANPNPYPYVHNDPTNATDPSGAQDDLEEVEVTEVVDAEISAAELSPEAQLVQQLAQDAADQGPAFLQQFLTEGELQALQDMPYLARAFYGTAIQRAVAAALEDLGVEFVFNSVGPDFAFGDVLVELTTESGVAAHLARGGLYLIAEIVTYVLEL